MLHFVVRDEQRFPLVLHTNNAEILICLVFVSSGDLIFFSADITKISGNMTQVSGDMTRGDMTLGRLDRLPFS